jgi:hypothetical protein
MRTALAVSGLVVVCFIEGQAQPRPRILIDASRAAGVWWWTGCSWCERGRRHQGFALTEYLRRKRDLPEQVLEPLVTNLSIVGAVRLRDAVGERQQHVAGLQSRR